MVDAPEKIWIEQDNCPYFYEESELTEVGSPVTEYVRADLYAALARADANAGEPVATIYIEVTDPALMEFAEWFRRNYPGPDTIIHKPDWHAPKIFRAAIAAARAHSAPQPSGPVDVTDDMANAALKRSMDKHLSLLTNTEAMREIIKAALSAITASKPEQEVASGTVEVKLLEWVKHGNDYFADTVVGQYCVGLVHTSFRTVLRCITQGQWADIEVSSDDGLEDARDAAQADYERRILSALTTSKPEQECATEGCDKPATDYFERGGVGSHYCHDCYLKVQAVTTPPTAGGGDE